MTSDDPTKDSTIPNMEDLALALDNEGMIGFTRAFVEDLRQGLAHATPEHFPWIESLRRT